MVIKEEFDLRIPDEEAIKITTPQKLIDYLMSGSEVRDKCSRDYVDLIVWLITLDELCVVKENFTGDSRFIEDMGAG